MTVASQRLVGACRACEAAPRNRASIAFDVSVLFRYRERMKAHARRDPKPGAHRVSDPARDLFGPGAKGAAKGAADVAPASERRRKPAAPMAALDPLVGSEAGYTASDIEVLEGLEPVRRRPGMYIGGTDERALHHLFSEVIDNSMDEAVAGHASFIEVELEASGALVVTDNGRGIPVDPHPKFPGKSALEVIMTTLHAGGKFDSKVYETSGGLHGVGISVVNALSDVLEVEVARNQTLYRQSFSRGHAQGGLETVGRVQNRRGTRIRFHPDAQIFGSLAFDPRRLFKMARSKAYLFGGVEIRWRCAPSLIEGTDVPAEAVHRFPGGLRDYLARDIEGKELVTDAIFSGKITKPGSHGSLEWAVAWMVHDDGVSASYCNTIPTPEGGTHESGLRVALLRALREHAERVNQAKRMNGRHNRRRDGHLRLDAVGVHPRAGVPGPDQGQARHRRGLAHRRDGDPRRLRPLARRLAGPGQQGARLGDRPGRGAPAPTPGKGGRAQDRDAQAAAPRQARRLLGRRDCGLRNLHRRGRLGRRLGQAGARPGHAGDPPAARQDPERRLGEPRQARRQPTDRRPDPGVGLRHGRAVPRRGPALRQGDHHDGRRRRRRPHRFAADHLLLPTDAQADRQGAPLPRDAAALPAAAGHQDGLCPRRRPQGAADQVGVQGRQRSRSAGSRGWAR